MMKQETTTLLEAMEDIVNNAKIHSLDPEFYENAKNSLAYISEKLGMTQDEAMVLSFFFEHSSRNRIWVSSISDMINVSNIRVISMMNIADTLITKGYLKGHDRGSEEKYYTVPKNVVNSIRQNQPPTPEITTGLTLDEFFDHLEKIFDEEDVEYRDRVKIIEDLIESNSHLSYCKALKEYDLFGTDYFLVNVFANRLVNENDDDIVTHDWEDYIDSKSHVRRILKDLKNGDSELIQKGVFEPTGKEGVRDPNHYRLTRVAKLKLLPEMDFAVIGEQNDKKLTSHTSFAAKEMFYAPHIQSQIDRLADLLKPEKFKQVVNRLNENGMRQGFACLFYGSPGTGKTETVNQLARITGRDVLMVDVTQIKSCWVGESEQNIKALFDCYRKYVKEREVAPILLFNEADAVLGIRQEGAQRAVDKMENSIQNIILQEMETLEGVMIATTNLTCNLDKAFERRFIYKIEFERPTIEAKKQIWKSMIPSLSDDAVCSLAKDFDLSGGQIENISRKRTVELILSGNEPSDDMIREYCMSEIMGSRHDKRPKIGF